MSRIGYLPIKKEDNVNWEINSGLIKIIGPLGELTVQIPIGITVEEKEGLIVVNRTGNSKHTKALHGLFRSLLNNAIIGVSEGFNKQLELHGIGYKAVVEGQKLTLNVGFSHPVIFEAPEGIEFNVQKNTINIKGINKEKVGQIAAKIRSIRKPEPYKGKGIRYTGEYVRRKAGKTVKAAMS